MHRQLLPVHRDGHCQRQVLEAERELHFQTFLLFQAIYLGQIRELFLETRVAILGISIFRRPSVSVLTKLRSVREQNTRWGAVSEERLRVPELERLAGGQLAPG